MNAPPRLWTGEAVLDHALEVAGFKVEDLKRSMEVTREAMHADTKDGAPDHATRLRASENVFGWVGLRGSRALKESHQPQQNLIVMWVQTPDPLSSPTVPAPSSPNSTLALPENGHGSVSWSATDDSVNP